MTTRDIIKFLILRTVGNFLVLFAIFGAFATFGPALYYEASFRIAQARGVRYVVANQQISNQQNPNQSLSPTPTSVPNQPTTTPVPSPTSAPSSGVDNFAQVLFGAKEQILRPKDTEFSIVIPKIGASAKVFPNVDPSKEDEFLPLLQQGVAHAKGTVFPGITGNIYLFAHSTDSFWNVGRYNAIFYLIKDLKEGDEIIIFFQNKRHDYVVTGSQITSPEDVSTIVNAQKAGQEQLVLQTCWPPGTTFQRLLVFARPK